MKKVLVWGVIIGVLLYVLWSRFKTKKQSYQKPIVQETSTLEQISELPEGVPPPPVKDD